MLIILILTDLQIQLLIIVGQEDYVLISLLKEGLKIMLFHRLLLIGYNHPPPPSKKKGKKKKNNNRSLKCEFTRKKYVIENNNQHDNLMPM